jgi:hypothetical protein
LFMICTSLWVKCCSKLAPGLMMNLYLLVPFVRSSANVSRRFAER